MKKRSLFICVMTALMAALCAVAAHGQTLYTVRLTGNSASAHSQKHDVFLKSVGGVWSDPNKPGALYAGLFFEREDAVSLLKTLKEKFPGAIVVSTSPGESRKWLPRTTRIPLENLGYRLPLVIRGFRAYRSFRFPWSGSCSAQASSIILKLKFSPALKRASSLQVMVEKNPLKTISVVNSGGVKTVEIPLSGLGDTSIGDYLDVELSGYFAITGDRCIDELSGNLWALLLPGTSLNVVRKNPPVSVEEFLRCRYGPVTLVVKDKDRKNVKALYRLAGLIGAVVPDKKDRIRVSEHVETGTNIIIGKFDKDVQVLGTNLYVTAKGVDLLCSRWLFDLIGSNYTVHSMAEKQGNDSNQISFFDLGVHNRIMKGIGDLTTVVSFTPLDLHGWPSDMFCTLVFSHTPVTKKERAFLKVRLNGVLVGAHEISGEGGMQTFTFNLPSGYLQARNTLEIVFSYYLNRGECRGSFPEMEVTLFNDSFFTIKSKRSRPPLNLSTFFTFLGGKGALVTDTDNSVRRSPLVGLLVVAGDLNKTPPLFELISRDGITTGNYDYYILQLKPRFLHQLDPVIDLEPAFKIINPLTKKVLLEFKSSDPVSVLQTFYNPAGKPVLVYCSKNGSQPTFEGLKKVLFKGTRGNVAVFTNGNWRVMEIGEKLRVKYPYKKDVGYYWARYKVLFVVCAGFIVLLFLFYVYRRLSGEEVSD